MLKGLDALIFDIADMGVRFYTYETTMAYAMEEAAKRHIAFFVLDRPDPIDGVTIEGPMLDPGRLAFTAYFPMPVRYAMTMGELAKMFNAENKIGADLHVIEMKNWRRTETYEATGLAWIPPSPSLKTLNAVALYPGIEILQGGGVSVGRGTDAPFELFGAPWIDGPKLAGALNRDSVPGVRFVATQFTPASDVYKDTACHGVSVVITDRVSLRPMLMGMVIASELNSLYPNDFHPAKMMFLVGSASTIDELQRGVPTARIVAGWAPGLVKFRVQRAKYLLYRD